MMPTNLNAETLARIQTLIEANFTGRDELYAAAELLDDRSREHICRRLADHLAANAIELQQCVLANGTEPAGPLDVASIARALFDLAKSTRGESGVLSAAAEGEHNLKDVYDQAIEAASDQETKAMLCRQREEVEFGEEVLQNMEWRINVTDSAPEQRMSH